MSISAVKDNPLLLDQIKFASKLNNYNDQEQSGQYSSLKSSDKKSSNEQKSTIVSEKTVDQSQFATYNFRLQSNVPLSKPDRPEKSYNDSKKKQTVEVEDQETGELLESELIEDEKIKDNPKGKGFYMNAGDSFPAKKQSKSMTQLFQEKINRIYSIGFTREPGTLVNLVY